MSPFNRPPTGRSASGSPGHGGLPVLEVAPGLRQCSVLLNPFFKIVQFRLRHTTSYSAVIDAESVPDDRILEGSQLPFGRRQHFLEEFLAHVYPPRGPCLRAEYSVDSAHARGMRFGFYRRPLASVSHSPPPGPASCRNASTAAAAPGI